MEIPKPQRPSLSGYVEHGKLLPWKWVDARMAEARSYWISSCTSTYPSSRPVWGIWLSPILLFSTGSLIGANIQRDPSGGSHDFSPDGWLDERLSQGLDELDPLDSRRDRLGRQGY